MRVIVWIDDPRTATALMNDLVFSKNHTPIHVRSVEEIEGLLWVGYQDTTAAVIVDSRKRYDAVKSLEFAGQVSIIKPTIEVAGGNMKLDDLIVRAAERNAQWFKEYGFRNIVNGVMALGLRSLCYLRRVLRKEEHVYALIYTQRTGHLAYNTAAMTTALKRRNIAASNIHPLFGGQPADTYLTTLFSRTYQRTPSKPSRLKKYVSLPIFCRSRYFVDSWQFTDVHCPLQRLDDRYDLDLRTQMTQDERRIADKHLRERGIKEDYVVFHSRDDAYLKAHQPNVDWTYHDFRDADIDNYLSAAKFMSRIGVQAVRVGITTDKPLDPTVIVDDDIIDYAQNARHEIADLQLIQNARFLLGSNCGLTQLAQVLHVPVAIANWSQLELLTTFVEGDLMIPKKIYSLQLERVLTLTEILGSGIGRFTRKEQFESRHLTLIENSHEEIMTLCQEMYYRLIDDERYAWYDEPDDIKRQAAFRKIINQPHLLCAFSRVRVGARYLEQNDWLMR